MKKRLKKMSKKKVKPNFKYSIVYCVLCNKKIKILQKFNQDGDISYAEWVEEYQKNRKSYEWESYFIKAGMSTTMQSGYLCSKCYKKPELKRIKSL